MNQITELESVQLEKVVNESGLAIQEGEAIKQSYLPFLNQLMEIQEQAVKINFETPTQLDETIARELRLKTVKIRTGAEGLKDERKKIHLLKGNLEQAAYNIIAASCKLTEETFASVEKAREIAEKKRKELLEKERLELLIPYEVDGQFLRLGEMSDSIWESFLLGQRTTYEAKKESEKKAEEERIAKEKAEAEERERIKVENERLKAEAIEREKQVEIERKKQAEILEKQKAEAEAKQKAIEEQMRKEREAAELERKRIEAENQARLKVEAIEREKLQSELKAKKEAEERELFRIESERKAKEIADKKAAMAPDKEKLKTIISSLSIPRLSLSTENANSVARIINEKFDSFKTWANSQIETL
jgi:colicin import membrane protein